LGDSGCRGSRAGLEERLPREEEVRGKARRPETLLLVRGPSERRETVVHKTKERR